MSPTARAAAILAGLAVLALVLPLGLVALGAVALVAAVVVDGLSVRAVPGLEREIPPILSRSTPARVRLDAELAPARRVRVRQVVPPALTLEPDAAADGELEGRLTAYRRGRHELPAPGTRAEGRLGLAAWHHRPGGPAEVRVYPDIVTARRLALAVRQGRISEGGRRARGPLGLGTEFESVREWLPDDDVRHVNWRATERMGHPMTNQYRLDQERHVLCLVDAGRLMSAPLGDGTRLDVALDALAAVAAVADELGDHCGAIAFDAELRGNLAPRRGGGAAAVRALHDLEPRMIDADYELAFRAAARAKRALVLVLTDFLDDAAARALVSAVPVLSRRHAVVVASARDPDLDAAVSTPPETELDVLRAATAVDLLETRARAAALVGRGGAQVLEAAPGELPAACVRAYLRLKARARL